MPFRIRVFLSIFLALLVLLLLGPLLLPVPPLEGTVSAGDLAREDSRFVTVAGVRLHYFDEGEGEPPFLLLHGYPANASSWDALLSELALLRRSVAFDQPGFGLSEKPVRGSWRGRANPYGTGGHVEQGVALLDELGIDRAVWVGSSTGALTALKAAEMYPERVAALVLLAPPVYSERAPPGWLRPLLGTPQLRRLGPLLMRQLGGEPGMRLYASQWHDAEGIGEDEIEGYRLTFEVNDWDRGLWEVTRASRPQQLAGSLAGIEQPALVVTGAADPIVDPEESERLARELPKGTLALLEDCGHLPQQECPLELVRVLAAWLPGALEWPQADRRGRPAGARLATWF